MAAGAVDDRVPHPERERSFHIWIDPRRPGQEGALIHPRILLAAVAVTFASALALASSEPPHHADPCFDQQVRHTTARAGARTTFNALQTLRTQRGYLESLWESTRETGYLSAVVDVGMMAGSLWTKPLAAGLGMTLAK